VKRDSVSQKIMSAAMTFVKTNDRSALESFTLSDLKKADQQLGDRDLDKGYRSVIKELISELEDKSEISSKSEGINDSYPG